MDGAAVIYKEIIPPRLVTKHKTTDNDVVINPGLKLVPCNLLKYICHFFN